MLLSLFFASAEILLALFSAYACGEYIETWGKTDYIFALGLAITFIGMGMPYIQAYYGESLLINKWTGVILVVVGLIATWASLIQGNDLSNGPLVVIAGAASILGILNIIWQLTS